MGDATEGEGFDDREEKIAKLKGFLTRSMKSEKRKELHLAALRADLEEKERQLVGMARELELAVHDGREKAATIAELSSEVERLKRAAVESPGVRAQKLKEMLDTSNLLYSELQARYEGLLEQSGRSVGSAVVHVLPVGEQYALLRQDGTYEVVAELGPDLRELAMEGKARLQVPPSAQSDGALKALLLQFFGAEGSKQRALVPAIADAAGFSTDQRAAAMRRFQDRVSWLW